MNSNYNIDDEENILFSHNLNLIKEKNKLITERKKIYKKLFNLWVLIFVFSVCLYIRHSLKKIKINNISSNISNNNNNNTDISNKNNTDIIQNVQKDKIEKQEEELNNLNNNNTNIKKYMTNSNEKVGVVFVFESMFANGIGRMLSILFDELAKFEKYNLYLLTKTKDSYDFKVNEKVKQFQIYGNKTEIEKFNKESNIKYYVLNNELNINNINWFKSLGKKIININHGTFLTGLYDDYLEVYSIWDYHKLFDAFIQVVVDDYYAYKKLDFNNTFYIPNLYTFDADKTPNSNLTYKNLMIMGRENDQLKGGYYGIKAMSEIVKEVPDALLYFISSDYRIKNLEDLIKELNLTKNVKVLSYVSNVTQYFLNSSILLYPSKTESFPMVMNEGKAHGLPIVAFNVSYSPSYQKGVILVDMLYYTQMAKESIKLLNDYDYRKKMGMKAKLSLKEYSNEETVNKWDRLFSILDKDDPVSYKKLQNYTYEKYYDEEKAKERLESNYNFGRTLNKDFCCHTFNDLTNLTYIHHIKRCRKDSC